MFICFPLLNFERKEKAFFVVVLFQVKVFCETQENENELAYLSL